MLNYEINTLSALPTSSTTLPPASCLSLIKGYKDHNKLAMEFLGERIALVYKSFRRAGKANKLSPTAQKRNELTVGRDIRAFRIHLDQRPFSNCQANFPLPVPEELTNPTPVNLSSTPLIPAPTPPSGPSREPEASLPSPPGLSTTLPFFLARTTKPPTTMADGGDTTKDTEATRGKNHTQGPLQTHTSGRPPR